MNMSTMRYAFPLLLPVSMGAMLAFVQLVASFSDTARLKSLTEGLIGHASTEGVDLNEDEKKAIENARKDAQRGYHVADARTFLLDLVEGINPSMIAIDIWALTLLLGKQSARQLVRLPYEFPIVGMIGHFLLIPSGVACSRLAEVDDAWTWVVASTFTMVLAVLLGWYVRHGMWRHYEQPIDEAELDSTEADNDTQ